MTYRFLMASLIAALLLLPAFSAEQGSQPDAEPLLKDKFDDINYSFGHQLGAELLEKNIEFRPNAILQGLYDASFNSEPALTLKEMVDLVDNVRLGQLILEEPKGYRLKGQKFLADNYQQEGVTTLASGLQYKTLKSGDGKKPTGKDSVLALYRARTIEGQEFDNSYPQDIATPEELKISELLPGLTEALQLMKEGDKWEIYLPASLAYKDSGPMAGQTVIYELELLEVLPEFR